MKPTSHRPIVNKKYHLRVSLAQLVALATISILVSGNTFADDALDSLNDKKIIELKKQLDQLQKQIELIKNPPTKDKKNPIGKIGGFIKVNGVYSSPGYGENSIADEVIIGNRIPREDAEDTGDKIKISARESRIWYKRNDGASRFHIEADFTGNKPSSSETRNNNSDLRLRHAYGQVSTGYGTFTFGQNWTALQNRLAAPNKTLYGELPGEILKRNIQFRWTTSKPMNNGDWVTHLSAENPESLLMSQDGSFIRPDDDRTPDLIARTEINSVKGNISLGTYARELRCSIANVCEDTQSVFGIALSGAYKFNEKNELRMQFNNGDGIGRYAAGSSFPDATIKEDGSLNTVNINQVMLSFNRKWGNNLASALIYNTGQANGMEDIDSVTTRLTSYNMNTVWDYTKKIRFGLEFIYVKADWSDEKKGRLNRGIFTCKYLF